MEEVYKGYRILIKHYAAFRHNHRKYPEIFDYIIFREKEKVCKGYGFNNAREARIEAVKFINQEEKLLVREAAICAEEMED